MTTLRNTVVMTLTALAVGGLMLFPTSRGEGPTSSPTTTAVAQAAQH